MDINTRGIQFLITFIYYVDGVLFAFIHGIWYYYSPGKIPI